MNEVLAEFSVYFLYGQLMFWIGVFAERYIEKRKNDKIF